ncbi:MAG TPA: Uma2 family endonuclease [Isosphaeraceae bacterium]|nr:Uma2 family endonuclease [Isosphaeraceae bacterium]
MAHLFPSQGQWSEEEYLALPGNRLVEFSHGILEVLCSPTMSHQLAVAHLCRALWEFIRSRALGTAIVSPLPVRLWPGEYREPDVVFLLAEHADRMGEPFWDGADLVMEVVGDDDRRRDLEIKRREYAKAGIPEYWIVDPLLGRITVLRLEGDRYAVLGEFARGERATSSKADGFALDVAEALKGR